MRADLVEAAKVTGPLTLTAAAPAANSEAGAPVVVTEHVLGQAPAKPRK